MNQLGFTRENRERLDAFLAREHPPGAFAALDLDGTCVHNDTGEAVLDAMAREGLLDVPVLLGTPSLWRPFEAQPALPDPRNALEALLGDPAARGRAGEAVVRGYRQLVRCAGKEIAYPWAACLLGGKTPEEVRAISRRVLEAETRRPLDRHQLEDGVCEERPFVVEEGIRPYDAMTRLVGELERAGVAVWIVTASNRWTAEVYAGTVLDLPPERVIGMTPRVSNGRIVAEMDPAVPVTFGEGKVEAIRAVIGHDPVFAAGDSLNQCEMLCHATELRLVIDKGDENLLQRVIEFRRSGQDNWLVQPRFIDPIP